MPARPELEQLLTHANWVRNLALQLCADVHAAEDAAQDTLAAALRHPPREPERARGFLARTLHNALAMSRRGERRRARREQLATPPADSVDASELVARAELHRHLVAAVLALPAASRELVLRHYFEGDDVATLARRSGITPDAVRAQLRRARERLRGNLERDGGEPARAFLLLVAASRPEAIAAATTTSAGLAAGAISAAGVMTIMKLKILAAAALVVLPLAASWLWFGPTVDRPPVDQAVAAQMDAHATPSLGGQVGANPDDGVVAAATAPVRETAEVDGHELRMRVVHRATGEPIAAAAVFHRWNSRFGRGVSATVATDRDGCARLPVEAGAELSVHAVATGFVANQTTLEAVPGALDVEIALEPETQSLVRVVDAETNEPIAGARVHATRPIRQATTRPVGSRDSGSRTFDRFDCSAPAGVADAEGLVRLAGLGRGFHLLVASAPGHVAARTAEVELPPQPSPLVIALAKGQPIPIEVTDAEGRPLAGREVMVVDLRSDSCYQLRTDAQGKAESPGYAAGATVRVSVSRDDLSPVAEMFEMIRRTTQRDVVVPVAEPVRIVVPGERTDPIDCVWQGGRQGDALRLVLFQERPGHLSMVDQAVVPAESGRWQAGGLGAGRYVCEARGTQSGIWRAAPVPFGHDLAAQLVLREIVPRDANLTVLVRSADGEPAAGVAAELSATDEDLGLLVHQLPPGADALQADHAETSPRQVLARGRTDATGTVRFTALLPGTYGLELVHPTAGRAIYTVTVRGQATDTCELAAPGVLRGRVVGKSSATRVVLRLEHTDLAWRRTVPVAEDGTFRVELTPGPYRVQARFADAWVDGVAVGIQQSATQTVAVTGGAETSCELPLSTPFRRVEVTVVGAEPGAYDLLAERIFPHDAVGASRWLARRPVPRDGTVAFEQLESDASFGLLLVRRADDHLVAVHSLARHRAERVTMRVGGGVTVRVFAPAGVRLELLPVHAEGQVLREAAWSIEATAGGEARFDDVPAGSYRLRGADSTAAGRFERRTPVEVAVQDVTVDWR